MLAVVLLIFVFWILLNNKINKQMYLFITTLVVTMFFFDSKDPIVGMPLYFEVMLVSILYTLFTKGFTRKLDPSIFLIATICILVLQMINLSAGLNVVPTILLKVSSTDVLDITSELKIPTLNFTVIKHFVFMVLYMIFALLNMNLLKQKIIYIYIYKEFTKFFKILFIGLIIESVIINLTGITSRAIMGFLFNTDINMLVSWETFISLKAVSLWMCEPSGIGCVFVYYLMLFTRKEYSLKNLLWIIISFIAVLLTGSTTGLVMAILCGSILFIDMILSLKTTGLVRLSILLFAVCSLIFIFSNSKTLFAKLNVFINDSASYGSGHFRKQSIEYGLAAFKFSPLIGLGIGTNYCHSGLVQMLSNIGILGTLLYVCFNFSLFPKHKIHFKSIIKIFVIAIYLYASSMIQVLTSPYFLILIIIISPFMNKSNKLQGEKNEHLLCFNQL